VQKVGEAQWWLQKKTKIAMGKEKEEGRKAKENEKNWNRKEKTNAKKMETIREKNTNVK
jgi:hypothetical protein